MARRINQDGTRNKQDWNCQDGEVPDDWPQNPQQRAIWKFREVVGQLATEGEYYDLLPPAAQDIVTAAKLLAGKMGGQ